MTGPEHYTEAERLVAKAETRVEEASAGFDLKAAHVHAMLAVAAATVESCVNDNPPSAGWLDIIRPNWREYPNMPPAGMP